MINLEIEKLKTTIRLDVPAPGYRIIRAFEDATSVALSNKLRMRSYPQQRVEPFVAPGVEPLVEQLVIAHIEAKGWNGQWSKVGDLQIRTTGLQVGGRYNRVSMYINSSKKPEEPQYFGGYFRGRIGGMKVSPLTLAAGVRDRFLEAMAGRKGA